MSRRVDGAKTRPALIARDGAVCFYCNAPLTLDGSTIEHVVSRIDGGSDHIDNLKLSHAVCNKRADSWSWKSKVKRSRQPNWEPTAECFVRGMQIIQLYGLSKAQLAAEISGLERTVRSLRYQLSVYERGEVEG